MSPLARRLKKVEAALPGAKRLITREGRRRAADMTPEERHTAFVDLIRQAIEQMASAEDAEPQHTTRQ